MYGGILGMSPNAFYNGRLQKYILRYLQLNMNVKFTLYDTNEN